MSLKKSVEFKVYTLPVEPQPQWPQQWQSLLLRIMRKGVRAAESCRDRWRETPRRAKEQSSGSASRRPYRLQNQSLWGLVLFDLSTAICTVSTFPILKSSPLLAFKTGHILSFLLLLWLLLSRLGFTPCQTICPLSVGGVEREDNLTESKTNQFSYTLRKLDPLFNFYSVAV